MTGVSRELAAACPAGFQGKKPGFPGLAPMLRPRGTEREMEGREKYGSLYCESDRVRFSDYSVKAVGGDVFKLRARAKHEITEHDAKLARSEDTLKLHRAGLRTKIAELQRQVLQLRLRPRPPPRWLPGCSYPVQLEITDQTLATISAERQRVPVLSASVFGRIDAMSQRLDGMLDRAIKTTSVSKHSHPHAHRHRLHPAETRDGRIAARPLILGRTRWIAQQPLTRRSWPANSIFSA